MYKQVYLKRGKEESLLRFHPWIFSGAINKIEEGLEEGDIVQTNKPKIRKKRKKTKKYN